MSIYFYTQLQYIDFILSFQSINKFSSKGYGWFWAISRWENRGNSSTSTNFIELPYQLRTTVLTSQWLSSLRLFRCRLFSSCLGVKALETQINLPELTKKRILWIKVPKFSLKSSNVRFHDDWTRFFSIARQGEILTPTVKIAANCYRISERVERHWNLKKPTNVICLQRFQSDLLLYSIMPE